MKKLFLSLALSVLSLTAIFAQTYQKGETIYEFKPSGYMQLQGGVGQTIGEGKVSDLLSPAAALNFGYQFKPSFGLRYGLSGWQAKGVWANPYNDYKFNYLALNVDAVLNFSNLFAGWNPFRVVNISGFLGVGANWCFNNDEAKDLDAMNFNGVRENFRHLWDKNHFGPVGRAGIIVDFRCGDHWNISLEGNANMTTDQFNSKHANNADWYMNYLAGVTYKFGKGYTEKKIERPAEPEPVAMCGVCNKPLTECQYGGNHPKCVTCGKYLHECEYNGNHPAPKPAPAEYNIFFQRNSSFIAPDEDAKIKACAEYMKANPTAVVSIVSYADIKTGNARINQKISEKRSAAVAKCLSENYGIAVDRITTAAKGDTVQPFSENDMNRVSIVTAEVK